MHVMYICIYLLVYRTPGMHVMYISSGVQDTRYVYVYIFWCTGHQVCICIYLLVYRTPGMHVMYISSGVQDTYESTCIMPFVYSIV